MSRILTFCCLLALVAPLVGADATEAAEADAAWFAGTWQATRGIAAEGETLIAGAPTQVVIRHLGGARIERDFPLPSGAIATTAYTVMSFNERFPWWTDDFNGNLVSRRAGADSFQLAPVGNMGKADWDNGWTYVRVPTQTGE